MIFIISLLISFSSLSASNTEPIFELRENEAPLPIIHREISSDERGASNHESVIPSSPIRLDKYFNRDSYIKDRINLIIQDEKTLNSSYDCSRKITVFLQSFAAFCSFGSLVISSLGSSDYLEPKLANVINIILGLFSGACMWGANQASKAGNKFLNEQQKIQKSLGIPTRLLEPNLSIKIDEFKTNSGQD